MQGPRDMMNVSVSIMQLEDKTERNECGNREHGHGVNMHSEKSSVTRPQKIKWKGTGEDKTKR